MNSKRPLCLGLFVGTTEDSYGHALLSGALNAAKEINAQLVVFSSGTINSFHGNEAQRNVLYDLAGPESFDAFVLAGSLTHSVSVEEMSKIIERFQPAPSVSISVPIPGAYSVMTDNTPGMQDMMKHILDLHGPVEMAFISGPSGQMESEIRKKIFLDSLEATGVDRGSIPVYTGDFTWESGKLTAKQILLDGGLKNLKVLVCANDSMALGAMEEFLGAGIKIPGQICVTGFDDMEEGAVFSPSLTSVRQPEPEVLAYHAVKLASELYNKKPCANILLPSVLIVRESCGTPVVSGSCKDENSGGLNFDIKKFKETLAIPDKKVVLPAFLKLWDESISKITSFRDAECVLESLSYILEDFERQLAADIFKLASSRFFSIQHLREARLRLSAENRMNRMRDVTEAFITCFTPEDVYEVIVDHLPMLGVSWLSLALFEDTLKPFHDSNLVLEIDREGHKITNSLGKVFPSQRLHPLDTRLMFSQAELTVIEAIYSKNERLGFVLIGTTLSGSLICGALRTQISSALHNVRLIETLRKNQDQLIQQEKLAGLGALVAGVAHEINTPLGVALTASTFSQEQIEDLALHFQQGKMTRSELEHVLDDIRVGSNLITVNLERASALVQSFRQIASDQGSDYLIEFPLKAYMDKILLSLAPQWKHRPITVEISGSDALTILGYPGVISQVFTNLLINSLNHAFPNARSGNIKSYIHEEYDYVRWVFQDDGEGIDSRNLSQIFDPFFTTKRGQGGTGLGLHVVYNLVTGTLGGTINCRSQLGEGTTFTLRFPRRLTEKKTAP